MVALGYVAGLYDLPRDIFRETIRDKFVTKSMQVVESNLAAFDLGFERGSGAVRLHFNQPGPPVPKEHDGQIVMMSGNAAVVRGCLDAGLENFFGYPITPATPIMEQLAQDLPERGGSLLQTEDEISAAAATLGAAFAGTRAATATSGPGLALMTEMLGLASMAEIPAVFLVSQRGGPSTGLPTKTEQSDLNLAVFGAAGDAPRIVLAPTNVEGCYRCAGKAFEMAEQYQTPVIVLFDLYLSNRYEAVELSESVPFARDCHRMAVTREGIYQRFEITEDGISPRAIPGTVGFEHVVTGLEHDALGRPCDAAATHEEMSHKRSRKLLRALEHPNFTHFKRFGDAGAVDIGLLGWGSSFGEILEAMYELKRGGIRCAAMKVVMLSPFPVGPVMAFIDDCEAVLVPELNHLGQFADLVGARCARAVQRMTRVSGMPLRVEEIVAHALRLARSSDQSGRASESNAELML